MATVYAVASGKGGVGKTTTAAALGDVLAAAGFDTVVVDADLGMPNLAGTLGVDESSPNLHDVLAGSARVEEAIRTAGDLDVLAGGHDLSAYRDADPASLRDVVDSLSSYEYVVLDTGAGLSHDNILPLGLADGVLLVSTPDRAALRDAEKTRTVGARLGSEAIGAVLTRVPESGSEDAPVGEFLDVDVLGSVPEDPAVAGSLAAQQSVSRYAPRSPAATAYRRLARELTGEEIPEPETEETADGAAEETEEGDAEKTEVGDAEETEEGDAEESVEADESTEKSTETEVTAARPAEATETDAEAVDVPTDDTRTGDESAGVSPPDDGEFATVEDDETDDRSAGDEGSDPSVTEADADGETAEAGAEAAILPAETDGESGEEIDGDSDEGDGEDDEGASEESPSSAGIAIDTPEDDSVDDAGSSDETDSEDGVVIVDAPGEKADPVESDEQDVGPDPVEPDADSAESDADPDDPDAESDDPDSEVEPGADPNAEGSVADDSSDAADDEGIDAAEDDPGEADDGIESDDGGDAPVVEEAEPAATEPAASESEGETPDEESPAIPFAEADRDPDDGDDSDDGEDEEDGVYETPLVEQAEASGVATAESDREEPEEKKGFFRRLFGG